MKKVISRTTGEEFAVKIIDRKYLGDDEEMSLQLEVDILSQLDHPNVVRLLEIFDES